MPGPDVTAAELWHWILDHAEEVDGRLVCREPIWGYLGERGVPVGHGRQAMRARLVKELTAEGKVIREHPRSGWLFILEEPG